MSDRAIGLCSLQGLGTLTYVMHGAYPYVDGGDKHIINIFTPHRLECKFHTFIRHSYVAHTSLICRSFDIMGFTPGRSRRHIGILIEVLVGRAADRAGS